MNAATQLTRQTQIGRQAYFETGVYWTAIGIAMAVGALPLSIYWAENAVLPLFAGTVLLAAVAAALSSAWRPGLYALGIPFLVGQLFAWLMQGIPYTELGTVTMGLQALLLCLLVYLLWIGRTGHAGRATTTHH